MIDLTYPNILTLLKPHLAPKRTESASFLIWYFENYLRLDTLDAVDAVCDQKGDKGIDGIYLNSDGNVIEVYQSRLVQKKTAKIGDKPLREFQGTLTQFASDGALKNLVSSAGNGEVAKLVTRLDLFHHLSEFEVIGYFICNSEVDANGAAFLKTSKNIRFVGRSELEKTYVASDRSLSPTARVSFSVSGYDVAEYNVDRDHRAVIAPVMASELVKMDGIADQAIFAFNVRGPLGRTQVNRDIAHSIGEQDKHKLFPLFHNGITIVSEKLDKTNDSIEVQNYYVVNGCQSLNALFDNKRSLTRDLRILTKFIQAPPKSSLAEMITRFSNNQNGVKARDFKSNNQIQIRLQNEFTAYYSRDYFFEIKRGEDPQGLEVISNEVAGQYLMAFDLKIPWATHRKYQIFEDRHSDLFGRPIVNADRIVLCHVMASRIDACIGSISNTLFARYALTKFFLLYILRLLLENDTTAQQVLNYPKLYIHDRKTRNCFGRAIDILLTEVITDLNAEIDQLEEDFDYRGKLRDEKWCNNLAHEIAATHKKLVDRHRLEDFGGIYKGLAQQGSAANRP
jgi:hypothetical protein